MERPYIKNSRVGGDFPQPGKKRQKSAEALFREALRDEVIFCELSSRHIRRRERKALYR